MEGHSSAKVAPTMSKDDDEMDEVQRRLGNCLQQVLTNHLVCENIASFLSFSDMKAASEVSRQFLQAIRGTRRFTQTAVLVITDKNLEDIKSFMRMTDYKWRGVNVDVTDPTNILEDLRRVLKSAELVSLQQRQWMNVDRALRDATAVSLLTAVLSSSPNLSELTIDIRLLSGNFGGVWSSPAVKRRVKNLDRLEFMKTELNCHWGYPWRYLNSDEEDTFWMNFGMLTGLPNRLKCFRLSELTLSEEKRIDSLRRLVLRILGNNRASLEHLELHSIVWRIEELQTLTFPALKTLTASGEWNKEKVKVGEFLKNQKSLEELTLTSREWRMRQDILTEIQECSVGLKKLHFVGQTMEELDWSFLASMSRLKDFRLKMRGHPHIGHSLLASLPKDQLECLSLEGLCDMWDTRSVKYGGEREFGFQTHLLQGFRCLRKLSFLGVWDALDDQLMQWLLKEFPLLEDFQLSRCSKLTDAGISGRTTAEWGRDASFADLCRLKTLKIVKCHRVTPNGVLASCVNVPCLKSLEYTNPPGQVVESVVMALVGQNPRLERLTLVYAGDFWKLKAKVTKKNPRVGLSWAEEEDE